MFIAKQGVIYTVFASDIEKKVIAPLAFHYLEVTWTHLFSSEKSVYMLRFCEISEMTFHFSTIRARQASTTKRGRKKSWTNSVKSCDTFIEIGENLSYLVRNIWARCQTNINKLEEVICRYHIRTTHTQPS